MTSSVLMLDDVDNSTKIIKQHNCYQQSEQLNLTSVKRQERPSFLNVSRENLTISQSDIEQGFNRHCLCTGMNKQTAFSVSFIALAIICIAFETFQLSRVLDNSREIDILKEELDTLRRQFYEQHVLDELQAFEQQLYDDDGVEDNSDDEDYKNYEDYDSDSNDYDSGDYQKTSKAQLKIISTASSQSHEKNVYHGLDSLHDFEQEEQELINDTKLFNVKNNNNSNSNNTDNNNSRQKRQKRFVSDEPPIGYSSDNRPIFASSSLLRQGNPETNKDARQRDLPKKKRKFKILDTIPLPYRLTTDYRGKSRVYRKVPVDEAKKLTEPQGTTRRHFRQPRQMLAAHFVADSSLFNEEDEHTGNGRARHNEGIFKAWRASDWMEDFAMNRHFLLNRDGKLTVYEAGLYLIYAQIHYLDEHDENGFHLLVNGRPILQCMVYSPGTGHKSRSCFSSQVTFLQSGDKIIIKDIGVSRYTLFQRDKSFFGLAKIGEMKHTQIQSSQLASVNY